MYTRKVLLLRFTLNGGAVLINHFLFSMYCFFHDCENFLFNNSRYEKITNKRGRFQKWYVLLYCTVSTRGQYNANIQLVQTQDWTDSQDTRHFISRSYRISTFYILWVVLCFFVNSTGLSLCVFLCGFFLSFHSLYFYSAELLGEFYYHTLITEWRLTISLTLHMLLADYTASTLRPYRDGNVLQPPHEEEFSLNQFLSDFTELLWGN